MSAHRYLVWCSCGRKNNAYSKAYTLWVVRARSVETKPTVKIVARMTSRVSLSEAFEAFHVANA